MLDAVTLTLKVEEDDEECIHSLYFVLHVLKCKYQLNYKKHKIKDQHHRHIQTHKYVFFPEMFSLLHLRPLPPGEEAPASSAKKATQRAPSSPSSGQRPLTGELRETASGSQEAPDGC